MGLHERILPCDDDPWRTRPLDHMHLDPVHDRRSTGAMIGHRLVVAVVLAGAGCVGCSPAAGTSSPSAPIASPAPARAAVAVTPPPAAAAPATTAAPPTTAALPSTPSTPTRPSPEVVAVLTTDAVRPVVVVARRGRVHTAPSGAPVGGPPEPWAWGPALEDRISPPGARPARVMTDAGTVRLLLHVEDADLGVALVTSAILRPAPGQPALATAFVELASGMVVDVRETSDDGRWVRVAHADPFQWKTSDVVEGWVPATSVGAEVTVRPLQHRAPPRHIAEIDAGAVLLDAPQGRPLITFPRSSGTRHVRTWSAVPLGPPTRGHQHVEYVGFCGAHIRLVGWVATDRVHVREDHGSIGGCGTGTGGPVLWGSLESAPREKVAAGRWLLDPTTGMVIGLVRRDTELARTPDGALHVATKFGPIPVALAPPGWKP